MDSHLVLRDANGGDGGAINALLAASFSSEMRPFMTQTQPGSEAYISYLLDGESAVRQGNRLLVAEYNRKVVGYAQFAVRGELGFLSYICINPEFRGRGLGQRLISHFAEVESGVSRLELDVFEDNLAAKSLYSRMGFTYQSNVLWLTRALAPNRPERIREKAEPVVTNWPFAQLAYERFGFCQLEIRFRGQAFQVGRLGSKVLRFASLEQLQDAVLANFLVDWFDEVRTGLAIVPEEQPLSPGGLMASMPPGITLMRRSNHMVLDIPKVR